MKFNPSNVPVVENDQHEPHCPWFLIGVTAPYVLQSHVAGGALTASTSTDESSETSTSIDGWMFKQPFKAPNSSVFKSAYSFKPTYDVWVISAFQFWT